MMFLANDPLNLSRAMILAPASQPVLSLKFVTHMVGVLLLENLEVASQQCIVMAEMEDIEHFIVPWAWVLLSP